MPLRFWLGAGLRRHRHPMLEHQLACQPAIVIPKTPTM